MIAITIAAAPERSPDILWQTNTYIHFQPIGISEDSAWIVSGAQEQVKVWNATNGVLRRAFSTSGADVGAVTSVALSSDAGLVGAGDGGSQVRVWRVSDGIRLWQTSPGENRVYSVVFSPDGSRFVEGRSNSHIIVHDPTTGWGSLLGGHEGAVYSVRFSRDGSFMGSASADRTAHVRRADDWLVTQILRGHSNAVYSVDFSPDTSLVATASSDGTARLWRVADGSVVRVIQGGGSAVARFSADGKALVTIAGADIKFWRASDGQLLLTYTNANAGPLEVAHNGKYFAYARSDGAVVVARMPTLITKAESRTNQFNFEWQGGSGLYQVQQTTSLTAGAWANLGAPTAATNAAVPMTNPAAFFRVQSLTNTP